MAISGMTISQIKPEAIRILAGEGQKAFCEPLMAGVLRVVWLQELEGVDCGFAGAAFRFRSGAGMRRSRIGSGWIGD